MNSICSNLDWWKKCFSFPFQFLSPWSWGKTKWKEFGWENFPQLSQKQNWSPHPQERELAYLFQLETLIVLKRRQLGKPFLKEKIYIRNQIPLGMKWRTQNGKTTQLGQKMSMEIQKRKDPQWGICFFKLLTWLCEMSWRIRTKLRKKKDSALKAMWVQNLQRNWEIREIETTHSCSLISIDKNKLIPVMRPCNQSPFGVHRTVNSLNTKILRYQILHSQTSLLSLFQVHSERKKQI